ncbi:tRNA pseudouridine55 synthase, partial [Tremellales sp. Uapishka_1]
MPKAAPSPPIPLNGLFPIAKPSGPTSMKIIDAITPLLLDSRLFDDPKNPRTSANKGKKRNAAHQGMKVGQGGTLDPLADGVLVIGVNRGTKHLNRFLECTKEYTSIALLGASTTTFDSEGPILTTAAFDGITKEDVEKVLDKFRGNITQVPPIFSALKMDGKPLYEYARENKPLPRPIAARQCTVTIDLLHFTPASVNPDDGGHSYRWPSKRLGADEKDTFRRLTDIVQKAQPESAGEVAVPNLDAAEVPEVSETTGLRPATFEIRMTVSSGTYVRSIVHDIGLALGCCAHVVKLTRTRQGEFSLHGDEEYLAGETHDGPSNGCIPWTVLEKAIEERKAMIKAEEEEKEQAIAGGATAEEIQMNYGPEAIFAKRRAGELKEWENELMRRFVAVPTPNN